MNRVQRILFGSLLLIAGLGLVAGGAYRVLRSGNSRVFARIKVLREVASAPESRPAGFSIEPDLLRKEMEVLRSDAVLSNVVTTLNLAQTWNEPPAEAVNRLRQKLEVVPVAGTALVELGIAGEPADEAAAILNAVADTCHAYERERREKLVAESVSSSVTAIEEQWKKLGGQISEVREELNRLQTPATALGEDTAASNTPPDVQAYTELQQKLELLTQSRDELEREFIDGKRPGPAVTCANVEIVARAAAPSLDPAGRKGGALGVMLGGTLLSIAGWLLLNQPGKALPGKTGSPIS